jgi:hypothetical protein
MAEVTEGTNFDMTDMQSAIGGAGRESKYEGRPFNDEEAKERARKHGYGERVDYNYTEKGSGRKVAKFIRCDWIATGDLGTYAPRIPELEAELFPDDFTYGKGMHIDILENVKIEATGEDPVAPIEKASPNTYPCIDKR